MLEVVTPESRSSRMTALQEMHRLRHQVFATRLGWEVTSVADLEMDRYDALDAIYLIHWDEDEVTGCVRFLPTVTGDYMLAKTFPSLLGNAPAPRDPLIWEASRFAVNTSKVGRSNVAAKTTVRLLAGMYEFAIAMGLEAVIAVTDLRVETIGRRVGMKFDRFSPPHQVGVTKAVAGMGPVSLEIYHGLLDRLGEPLNLTWADALKAA